LEQHLPVALEQESARLFQRLERLAGELRDARLLWERASCGPRAPRLGTCGS
jgi:hypothetical protein